LEGTSAEIPQVSGRRVDLSSGAVAYLAEDPTLPLVEISLAVRVGSFLEPPDRTGLALLTTSQLRRGGSGALDADTFDDRLDFLGARIDTMAGTTRSGASLSVPSWALDEGLDLFFRMLAEPAFQEDRLELARSNLREALSRRNEDPLEILQREWEWLMYGEDHFSTRPITPETLAALERRDLVEFHQRYWRPQRMILAVSGDFDRQEVITKIEAGLADAPAASAPGSTVPWPPPPPGSGVALGLYHYEMDIPQAKVMLGHRLPTLLPWTHRDRFALAVLGELLGGRDAISRVAGRLRTAEGLVYRASVELVPGDLWPGVFEIFFETRGRAVGRAIELAREEIERLRTEEVHPMELEVVKATLLARTQLNFDTAEEIAGYFAEDALLDRPHRFWQDYLDGISSLSAAEVRAAAVKYLQPDNLRTLIVGRWSEIGGPDRPASTSLEGLLDHPKTSLPPRDPLTLEPPGSP
jgi:predicted Zn-dependent peptidase